MNFYKRHLGDIAKSCGDLSQGQMGAYDLLMDWHYANEKPIPLAADKIYRIGRATTKIERSNVDSVIAELFTRTDQGYVQKRALEVMAKAAEVADINRAIAIDREAQKRADKEARSVHESFNVFDHEACENREPSHKPLAKEQDQKLSPANAVDAGIDDSSQPSSKKLNGHKRELVPIEQIVALYHESLPLLPHVEKITKARQGYIRQRWIEDLPTIDAWRNYFADVGKSRFLTGRSPGSDGKPPFRADLEWLCRPGNFAKVSEGKYHA